MGDEHVGQAQVVLQLRKKFQNTLRHQLIKRGGHLITDHELRLSGQGAGNANALFLAARKLTGQAVNILSRLQFNLRQQLFNPFAFGRTCETRIKLHWPSNNIPNRTAWIERCICHLVDHLHLTQLILAALTIIQRQGFTVKLNIAFAWWQ